ncbi:hypothetical protein LP316_06025 [Thalassotalea sp. LPB0316]|uniref:hypothetical protein n=1 Tax=Thalassotalea sp. LPB0316 TaxID=2769490 RepID=UPI001868D2D2|nr:hypothetical protein [Thalassotalea sp. LPB0316]QOL26848.1 hypothetical protein LP316_06025 [Thalassotalea sp. LPB0316]
MLEVLASLATLTILWMVWQLIRARRFNQFKALLISDIKPEVIKAITTELEQSRSNAFPNNEYHIQATLYFWTQYPIRILQAALERDIIDERWLKKTGNFRHSQHLMHIQQQYLLRRKGE